MHTTKDTSPDIKSICLICLRWDHFARMNDPVCEMPSSINSITSRRCNIGQTHHIIPILVCPEIPPITMYFSESNLNAVYKEIFTRGEFERVGPVILIVSERESAARG